MSAPASSFSPSKLADLCASKDLDPSVCPTGPRQGYLSENVPGEMSQYISEYDEYPLVN